MGLLLDIVYATGLVVSSPLWLYRMARYGRYRADIGQRFGAVPISYSRQPVIWIHGVSLGEINAARTLVDELHSQLPDYRIAISTTTATGMEAAKRLFAPDHIVFRWPLDFSFASARALARLAPELVVLMEGEAWPNFLAACNRRSIPAIIVNARMSEGKGFPRYKKLGPIATKLFNRLTAICTQQQTYLEMYRQLGVSDEKLFVTGMLKFDSAEVAGYIAGQDELADAMGISPDDKLIVAGGTGPGEEQYLPASL